MEPRPVRILFLADTHLGFDLPTRPKIERRRRGDDFFANYATVLERALDGRFDLVVHGGDVFFRSRVPASLVQRAFLPLKRLADAGIPVFLVPGNHERSKIPYPMLAMHPRIHIFDKPRSFTETTNGTRIALAGFPYWREGVRHRFAELVEATGWRASSADVNLLCVHHCFEGATVGPSDYVFRGANDVVAAKDVPGDFAAILTGHIHRHQVLTTDLRSRPLPTPVLYPGSIERTSFAEKDEAKGFITLTVGPGAAAGGRLLDWAFNELPARPMISRDVDVDRLGARTVESVVEEVLHELAPDSIVRFRLHGHGPSSRRGVPSARRLRDMAPKTMNVELRLTNGPRGR